MTLTEAEALAVYAAARWAGTVAIAGSVYWSLNLYAVERRWGALIGEDEAERVRAEFAKWEERMRRDGA